MGIGTVYLICAIAGGIVLLLKVILMVVGMDHVDAPQDFSDVGTGFEAGDGHSGGFNLLSVQSIAGFFTMFGLVGLGLLQIDVATYWTLAGALAAGLFTAWCTGMIMMGMRRLQSEGTLSINNALGQQGTVYLTIPEKGTGSISVTVQGTLRTMDAMSEKGQRIPTGSLVKVVGVSGGHILVVSESSTQA